MQERIFRGLEELTKIRAAEKAFCADANCYTVETGDNAVLCIVREYENDKITCIFNFRDNDFQWIKEERKGE